jgi:uncharacterized protein YjbI with pentapeptide repeats
VVDEQAEQRKPSTARLRPDKLLLRRIVILAGGLLLILFVLLFGPYWLTRQPATGLTADQELKARNDVRATLVQAIGAVGLAGGLIFTYRTYRLTQSEQVTARFAKAVEMLGSETSRSLQVGGVYALERIARDSEVDQPAVVSVLASFILDQAGPNRAGHHGQDAAVVAALNVLGRRRTPCVGEEPIQLPGAKLDATTVRGAHFEHANLTMASLHAAQLEGTHLEDSWLIFADLSGAFLAGAHLQRAVLQQANLSRALLRDTHFEDADLQRADLRLAWDLNSAHLSGADFAGAKVTVGSLTNEQLAVIVNSEAIEYFERETLTDPETPQDGPEIQV